VIPPLSAPFGPGSSSPGGEAVKEKEAFGPESVYRDPQGRPVDLLDGKAKRERSDRPGESSLSCRQQIHSTHDSEAKAATERSEGVAEAKREEAPKHSAAGRALAASECEQWARPKAAWIFRMLLQRKGY